MDLYLAQGGEEMATFQSSFKAIQKRFESARIRRRWNEQVDVVFKIIPLVLEALEIADHPITLEFKELLGQIREDLIAHPDWNPYPRLFASNINSSNEKNSEFWMAQYFIRLLFQGPAARDSGDEATSIRRKIMVLGSLWDEIIPDAGPAFDHTLFLKAVPGSDPSYLTNHFVDALWLLGGGAAEHTRPAIEQDVQTLSAPPSIELDNETGQLTVKGVRIAPDLRGMQIKFMRLLLKGKPSLIDGAWQYPVASVNLPNAKHIKRVLQHRLAKSVAGWQVAISAATRLTNQRAARYTLTLIEKI